MGRFVTKHGFCPDCRKNVHHVHVFRSIAARLVDGCTLWLVPKVLRLGSWHCRVCNRHSTLLAFCQSGALDYERQTPEVVQTAAGNFIKRDQSLVMRSERNSRYTKKFRQSVVERILNGKATLSSIREELNLSESDLIGWINEVVEGQAELISQLNRMVDVLLENSSEQARIRADNELVFSKRNGGEQQ
jgi:transposase-like protein